MIVSFRDKRTREFASGNFVKAFAGFARQAEMKLDQLEVATAVRDLAALPGNRLEALSNIGANILQGPHHAAQKSTKVIPSLSTNSSNSALVTFRVAI